MVVSNGKPSGRFLSLEECDNVLSRANRFASGEGRVNIAIESEWVGNIRWSRNEISTCGDVRNNDIGVGRLIGGTGAGTRINQISDSALEAAIRRCERMLQLNVEQPEKTLISPYMEPYELPKIWFDSTYTLLAEERAEHARSLIEPAEKAGMLSAGYIQVSANARYTRRDRSHWVRYTQAQFSVTVRDPKGLGSGWAGVDWNDWERIDGERIVEVALDKCLKSRNPVAIEPGRYTVVLEPQATHDFISVMFGHILDRRHAEDRRQPSGPYNLRRGYSKIGLRIVDPRVTIKFDPMDPDCSIVPFSISGDVYNPTHWIEEGVLTQLSYRRMYGITALGLNNGLPTQGSYHMLGGDSSVETMISNTDRGLLVTRFEIDRVLDSRSLLSTGVTRDGLWLIEKGKVSRPVKNMRFTESPLFTLNNLLEIGVPQRVFSPKAPAVVPAIRAQDFSFTSMVDAV